MEPITYYFDVKMSFNDNEKISKHKYFKDSKKAKNFALKFIKDNRNSHNKRVRIVHIYEINIYEDYIFKDWILSYRYIDGRTIKRFAGEKLPF